LPPDRIKTLPAPEFANNSVLDSRYPACSDRGAIRREKSADGARHATRRDFGRRSVFTAGRRLRLAFTFSTVFRS
jgi:hypothetical protein